MLADLPAAHRTLLEDLCNEGYAPHPVGYCAAHRARHPYPTRVGLNDIVSVGHPKTLAALAAAGYLHVRVPDPTTPVYIVSHWVGRWPDTADGALPDDLATTTEPVRFT